MILNLGILLRYEKILENHILAKLLAGNAWLFKAKKDLLHIRYKHVISEHLDFWRCASHTHRSNGKFTLNLCDAQVFKTIYSEKGFKYMIT